MLLSMDEPMIDPSAARCCCANKKQRVLGSRVGHFFVGGGRGKPTSEIRGGAGGGEVGQSVTISVTHLA